MKKYVLIFLFFIYLFACKQESNSYLAASSKTVDKITYDEIKNEIQKKLDRTLRSWTGIIIDSDDINVALKTGDLIPAELPNKMKTRECLVKKLNEDVLRPRGLMAQEVLLKEALELAKESLTNEEPDKKSKISELIQNIEEIIDNIENKIDRTYIKYRMYSPFLLPRLEKYHFNEENRFFDQLWNVKLLAKLICDIFSEGKTKNFMIIQAAQKALECFRVDVLEGNSKKASEIRNQYVDFHKLGRTIFYSPFTEKLKKMSNAHEFEEIGILVNFFFSTSNSRDRFLVKFYFEYLRENEKNNIFVVPLEFNQLMHDYFTFHVGVFKPFIDEVNSFFTFIQKAALELQKKKNHKQEREEEEENVQNLENDIKIYWESQKKAFKEHYDKIDANYPSFSTFVDLELELILKELKEIVSLLKSL